VGRMIVKSSMAYGVASFLSVGAERRIRKFEA
jgi:hypothetical protein